MKILLFCFQNKKDKSYCRQSFINHKLIIDDYYVIHLLDSSMEKYSHRLPNLEDKISAQLDRTNIKIVFVLVQFHYNQITEHSRSFVIKIIVFVFLHFMSYFLRIKLKLIINFNA